MALGDFFYVDGAFRFVPSEVFEELSTAPPMRVRQGGNLQESKLVTRINPVYPATKPMVRSCFMRFWRSTAA